MATPTMPGDDRQEELLEAVDDGIEEANEDPEAERRKKAEADAVKSRFKEYTIARDFDKRARSQYSVDRRYAAGTAITSWAVSANLIGSFIDILSAFLYARNPDVSVKKAPQVDETSTTRYEDLAKTAEIIVTSLWNAPTTRMKANIRQFVRSALTVGIGWFKATLVCQGQNIPEMKTKLNDARDNLQRLEALRLEVTVDENNKPVYLDSENNVLSEEELNAKTAEFRALEESISKRLEVAMRKALVLDFVAAEDVQVSLDVRCIDDNVNASWIANRIYRPKADMKAMFPTMTDADVRKATTYFQRNIKNITDISDNVRLTGLADETVQPDEADQYVTGSGSGSNPPSTGISNNGGASGEQGIEYFCIVEQWDRRDGHVYTMIDGLDKYAKQPYQPDYPSTRFFPYFGAGFHLVDGSRHPQSLVFRLRELADEYCSVRSSLRRTRARAVPGVIFNKGLVNPQDASSLAASTEQELIGIELDPTQSISNVVREKPLPNIDMRLYDTSPILSDMERISGIQEALSSSITQEKTATEAEIQQSGFSARTGADRSVLEELLTDLAFYTFEQALSALTTQDAQRIAGPRAYWPAGMAIDDLLSMVCVTIEAGTTGKPKASTDKQAWSTILPLLQAAQKEIRATQMMGDIPMATAQTELVKETMRRMGDESDVTRFIPQATLPAPNMAGPGMPPGAGLPPPGAPPAAGPMPTAVASGSAAGPSPVALGDALAPPDETIPTQ